MNKSIVAVDCTLPPSRISKNANLIYLQSYGSKRNVRIEINALRTGLLNELPERLDDLINLAASVYSADTRISRGTINDVFGTQWQRTIDIVLPVHDFEFWNTGVKQKLSKTLQFLTDDKWNFIFQKKAKNLPRQRFLFEEPVGNLPMVDTVISFSGGVDSLAAVIEAYLSGKKPLLISHRTAPVVSSRQKVLVDKLIEYFPKWTFPHISMWLNRKGGKRPSENTQRSRSFVYTCLSVVASNILKLNDVRLCDNGVVSLNLPQSGQTIGAYATRSTHPIYLRKVQELLRLVTENDQLSIINTLLYYTKAETMQIIAKSGYPELLQETNSCAHTEGMTAYQPHCGTCSQCVDRRLSSISTGLQEYDLAEKYKIDILKDDLKSGNDRTYVENYIRFVHNLMKLQTPEMFFQEYPQLFDCLDENAGESALKIYQLFCRHQKGISKALENELHKRVPDIIRGELPDGSLIKMLATGKHVTDLRIEYIQKLKNILGKSVPLAFKNRAAEDETHVQDISQAVLVAAKESLDRESPQLPFATVLTKPDFSRLKKCRDPLFLEFKHIANRQRLNHIITEMTSRVTIYRDQGAWILFVVYDPLRNVLEDDKFINQFECHQKVYVAIIR